MLKVENFFTGSFWNENEFWVKTVIYRECLQNETELWADFRVSTYI